MCFSIENNKINIKNTYTKIETILYGLIQIIIIKQYPKDRFMKKNNLI